MIFLFLWGYVLNGGIKCILLFSFSGDDYENVMKNERLGIFDAGDEAVNECLKNKEKPDKDKIFISQTDYDIYKIHFGSLTVYRFTLKCKCNNLPPSKQCTRFLPFSQQGWGGYMGSLTNSYFVPRKRF